MQYTTKNNEEYNSTEIYFDAKPDEQTRDALKKNGFRWHSVKKCWYGKKTTEDVAAILGAEQAAAEELPASVVVDPGSLYEGIEGGNYNKWSGYDDLKEKLAAIFKRDGIKVSMKRERAGYLLAIRFTVTLSPDCFMPYDEWREKFFGEALRSSWLYYTDEDGKTREIFAEKFWAINDADEREKLAENIRRTFYDMERRRITRGDEIHGKTTTLAAGALAKLDRVRAVVGSFNRDCSNGMIDYFDRAIYDDYCVKIA